MASIWSFNFTVTVLFQAVRLCFSTEFKFLAWVRDTSFDDVVVIDFTQYLYNVTDADNCGLYCVTQSNCTSFFFNPTSGHCVTSPVHFTVPAMGVPGRGFQYYRLKFDACPVRNGYLQARAAPLCYKVYKLRMGTWKNASSSCQRDGASLIRLDTAEKLLEVQRTLRYNYVCPDMEWVHFRNSCYQIFSNSTLYNAKGGCGGLGACSVSIETKEEDDFLQQYLVTYHPGVQFWRTSGHPQSSSWTCGNVPFNYTNWWPNYGLKTYYPTLKLTWHSVLKTYKWVGDWYTNSVPTYNQICERNAYQANTLMTYAVSQSNSSCVALNGLKDFNVTLVSCDVILRGFVCEKASSL